MKRHAVVMAPKTATKTLFGSVLPCAVQPLDLFEGGKMNEFPDSVTGQTYIPVASGRELRRQESCCWVNQRVDARCTDRPIRLKAIPVVYCSFLLFILYKPAIPQYLLSSTPILLHLLVQDLYPVH